MRGLTQIQQKAYDFIKDHISEKGYPPTHREIKDYMGYSAIGSVQCLVFALRTKGFLVTQDKQVARGLVPVQFPEMISNGNLT